jgi:DNA-binding NtrC family response regulator
VSLAIVGESGSGKLVLARYLQDRSGDGGPFTVLDAALARFEGAEAWSQWVRARLAQTGGTLVLRHLESLDQANARLLEAMLAAVEGRVGPRLVATVSVRADDGERPAFSLVDRFPAVVHVPPLRERPEDVADLVPALIRRHSPAPCPRCSEDVIRVLARAEWPGNVRQLEGAVKRMLARRSVGEVTLRDLPHEYLQVLNRRLTAMEHAERGAILRALEQAEGNKSQAAAILGISRVTLYRKLRALGLST